MAGLVPLCTNTAGLRPEGLILGCTSKRRQAREGDRQQTGERARVVGTPLLLEEAFQEDEGNCTALSRKRPSGFSLKEESPGAQ